MQSMARITPLPVLARVLHPLVGAIGFSSSGSMVKQLCKSEPNAFCVNGMEGKQLANAVRYKVQNAPKAIRDWYEGSLKYEKSATSATKKAFITALFSEEGFENAFFQRVKKTEKVAKGGWGGSPDLPKSYVFSSSSSSSSSSCPGHAPTPRASNSVGFPFNNYNIIVMIITLLSQFYYYYCYYYYLLLFPFLCFYYYYSFSQ